MISRFGGLLTVVMGVALLGGIGNSLPSAYAQGANLMTVQTTVTGDGFHKSFVQTVHQRFLGRAATAAETAPLVAQLQNGGKAWVTVITTVAGSPAYFKKAGNSNSAFVNRLFQDMVGRAPDAAEEATSALDFLKGGGTPAQLAEVLADNDAFRTNWTQIYYQKLLGRPATEAEASEGANQLSTDGLGEMVSTILSSAEYFQNSGNSQEGWQSAVNQALANNSSGGGNNGGNMGGNMGQNPPAPLPIDNGNNGAPPQMGNNARANMVQSLLESPEYLSAAVQRQYQRYLKRAATAAELQQWGGASSDQVMMGVLTSDEYFTRAGGTTTKYLNQLSLDLLGTGGGGNSNGKGGKNKKERPSIDLLELLRNLPIKNNNQ